MKFEDISKIDFVKARGGKLEASMRAKALESIPIGKAVRFDDPELFPTRKTHQGLSTTIANYKRRNLIKASNEYMVRKDKSGQVWIVRVA